MNERCAYLIQIRGNDVPCDEPAIANMEFKIEIGDMFSMLWFCDKHIQEFLPDENSLEYSINWKSV